MRQLPVQRENLSPEAYVSIDNHVQTGHQLTEDIITLVDRKDEAADASDDDDENEEAAFTRMGVTIRETQHHIERLVDFLSNRRPPCHQLT